MSELTLVNIINKRFALRSLLANESYHLSEVSVPKTELTPEKEPDIRDKLKVIAAQIVDSPDSILLDTYDCWTARKTGQPYKKRKLLKRIKFSALIHGQDPVIRF